MASLRRKEQSCDVTPSIENYRGRNHLSSMHELQQSSRGLVHLERMDRGLGHGGLWVGVTVALCIWRLRGQMVGQGQYDCTWRREFTNEFDAWIGSVSSQDGIGYDAIYAPLSMYARAPEYGIFDQN